MTLFPDEEDDLNVHIDPSSADSLLAKEMNALDLKERNALQEEIHGIKNPLFDETPEKVAKALSDLSDTLNRVPPSEKKSYLRSQNIPNSHIQTKSFHMRLLRCTGYCIELTATKIVALCDILVDLFGEVGLERPILLSDFSKKELQILRMGRMQFLPFGDCIGRRILVIFYDEVWEAFPARAKAKLSFYMSWVSADDDEGQKQGIVVVAWFDEDFKINAKPKERLQYQNHKLCTVRAASIHLCTPDTPMYRIRRAVATVRMGRARRSLRCHLGNSMENRYALQSFGIRADQIPISYTGKIKVAYIRQWCAIRRTIEDSLDQIDSLPLTERIIEYPKQDDVVFRQGSSSISHSANMAFRNLIIAKVTEQELSRDVPGIKIRRKKMVLDIINEVRVSGKARFLIWNENGGWNEIVDEEIIHAKIEYLIKEFRKSVRTDLKKLPKTLPSARGSIFQSKYFTLTRCQPTSAGIPLDLQHETDDHQLIDAACCVVNCFGMDKKQKSNFLGSM